LVGGLNFPNLIDNLPHLPNIPNGANVSLRATDFLDAADKHVPTLGLNARRKFFHALAVAMFLPGVAFDVRVLSALPADIFIYLNSPGAITSPPSPTYRSALHLPCSHSQNMSAILRYIHLELLSICSCMNFWIIRTAVQLF
jgi:hypothetical protein